jgi:hypothetical protein
LSEDVSYVWCRGSIASLLVLSRLEATHGVDSLDEKKLELLVTEIVELDTHDREPKLGLVQELHQAHAKDLPQQVHSLRTPNGLLLPKGSHNTDRLSGS